MNTDKATRWITAFNINVIECTLLLSVTDEPERPMPVEEYTFRSVSAIQVDRYHETKDNCLGDFQGIEEKKFDNDRSEFRINTGDALVIFQAASDYKVAPPTRRLTDS